MYSSFASDFLHILMKSARAKYSSLLFLLFGYRLLNLLCTRLFLQTMPTGGSQIPSPLSNKVNQGFSCILFSRFERYVITRKSTKYLANQ